MKYGISLPKMNPWLNKVFYELSIPIFRLARSTGWEQLKSGKINIKTLRATASMLVAQNDNE
jgi:hypothetical protein